MTTTAERVPFDRDAEQSVLGALVDASDRASVVLEVLKPGDFHEPRHRVIFETSLNLLNKGPLDATILKDELDRNGLLGEVGGAAYLSELLGAYGTAASIGAYVNIVLDLSLRRRAISRVEELRRAAGNGTDLEELATLAASLSEELSDGVPTKSGPPVAEIDAFLSANEPEFDWIIPDVMERGDRLVLIGREGQGKSTLLKQIGVQVAAGMHPFRDEAIESVRVLIVDLENSERELRRRLRAMRIKVKDRLAAGRLFVVSQPVGVDLVNEADDRAWLAALIENVAAEIVILGPLYKLADGDPNEEKSAKPVAKFLDSLRARYGCALMLEAHMPHDGQGGRPFGWSGWRRWPEIGIELTQADLLRPWRPARHDTSGIPPALTRGGEFPFTVATRPRDVLWARIVAYSEQQLGRPSIRDLAGEFGAGVATVKRALDEHSDEWEAMDE